jgi:hypothetical protein
MRKLLLLVFLSAVCPVLGQDLKADAEKDGQELAQHIVSKLKGISSTDWFGIADKLYAKHKYPETTLKWDYTHALENAYQKAYTELGSKVAGPRPDQTVSGDNEDVDTAIQKQLKLTPEDDYEFTLAGRFNLATVKGKPVWKTDYYQFKANGKNYAGTVIVNQGQTSFKKLF